MENSYLCSKQVLTAPRDFYCNGRKWIRIDSTQGIHFSQQGNLSTKSSIHFCDDQHLPDLDIDKLDHPYFNIIDSKTTWSAVLGRWIALASPVRFSPVSYPILTTLPTKAYSTKWPFPSGQRLSCHLIFMSGFVETRAWRASWTVSLAITWLSSPREGTMVSQETKERWTQS